MTDNPITFDDSPIQSESWWVARVGDLLVWARLRVLAAGPAVVLDSSGESVPYDCEESARSALLDAEYRAFDGIDDEDADAMGFDLDSVEPPHGDDDEALREQMFTRLAPRQ
jgi:hypothetical protein